MGLVSSFACWCRGGVGGWVRCGVGGEGGRGRGPPAKKPDSNTTLRPPPYSWFFFNDPATTEIYTLSLHDALPIYEIQLLAEPLEIGRVLVQAVPNALG